MVKRQKEKQYQSAREQREYGKLRAGTSLYHNVGTVQKTLPISCCALTLTPFETPVCTVVNDDSGAGNSSTRSTSSSPNYAVLFDNASLMEFVLKNQRDPVTGNPLKSSKIIRLHMDRDGEGRWQCPILTKPFADHTKIVAVLDKSGKKSSSPEAYVYSYEAYQELNTKPKNWHDLTTGNKFHPKKDVLLLNDPDDPELQSKRDINKFWHILHNRNKLAAGSASTSKPSTNIQKSVTATRIMEQIQKERRQKDQDKKDAIKKDKNENQPASLYQKVKHRDYKVLAKDVTGVQYTAGTASRSLTSTSMDVSNQNADREATEEEILQSYFRILKKHKKGEKGYVKLVIQFDSDNLDQASSSKDFVEILLELHCDIAPRTCMNFMGLCQQHQYDGTAFHRIIPDFMMQGGKAPDGKKDESLWGAAFVDEFDDRLKHSEGGILSMANAGLNTNLQQFFITFKPCLHLDRKHSIFGQVVDGMDRLMDRMKKVDTDKKERPVGQTVSISRAEIISDPIQEVQDQEDGRLRMLAQERTATPRVLAEATKKRKSSQIASGTTSTGSGIGKYLSSSKKAEMATLSGLEGTLDKAAEAQQGMVVLGDTSAVKKSAPKPKKSKFGDFSSW
ncbi:MAG: hypothetical protein SGILL_004578 [Bacillariaceae sp.]